jgi:hypothetical protein
MLSRNRRLPNDHAPPASQSAGRRRRRRYCAVDTIAVSWGSSAVLGRSQEELRGDRIPLQVPVRHSSLYSSNLSGTISNAVGAFVDIGTFSVFNNRLNGSLPPLRCLHGRRFFAVHDAKFNGALPVLSYRAMTQCVLCNAASFGREGCPGNAFSCPFPQGVMDRCKKFNGAMSYQPIVNADCYNTTASE